MADAGVVDEDVEAGELGDSGFDGFGAGDVEWEGVCRGTDGLGESFGGGEVEVGDPDGCAGAGELLDGGLADAAGAAGDEGVAIIEAQDGVWIHVIFAGDGLVSLMGGAWLSLTLYRIGR